MNATITNNHVNEPIPVTVWMGAQPTDDSLMLPASTSVTFANDLIGRVDCGVVPSNLTRLVHSLPAVDANLVSYIQDVIAWYNQKVAMRAASISVTVQDGDATHGIYCVVGTLANQQVVPVGQSLQFTILRTTTIGLYVVIRPVGFDAFTGPRGGSIPP